jgi:hypothetical protein
MNIADVSLAMAMGPAAGTVIAGILIMTWFVSVNYPATRNSGKADREIKKASHRYFHQQSSNAIKVQ